MYKKWHKSPPVDGIDCVGTIAPIQWVPGALSPGVKLPGSETGHSPPAGAEVKNGGAVPPRLHDVV
jgi:hypothetical protein